METTYEQLTAEGYVRAKPRSGYYVCKTEEPGLEQDQLQAASRTAERTAEWKADRAMTDQKRLVPSNQADSEFQEPLCRFDFTTQTVDTSFFPFATWARLGQGNHES